MRIAEMNWMQVEQHVTRDRRAVLPLGSTEQHAQLSLCVDAILADRVSVEAAQPLDVPVFPAISYGLTPSFVDYAGTVTLRLSTLCALVCDVLGGMVRSGFRQIVVVNGHGGNAPAHGAVLEWLDTPSRRAGEVAQLVQRAADLGQGEGDRSGGLTCLLDGKFSLDTTARDHTARHPETGAGPCPLPAP